MPIVPEALSIGRQGKKFSAGLFSALGPTMTKTQIVQTEQIQDRQGPNGHCRLLQCNANIRDGTSVSVELSVLFRIFAYQMASL